MTYSQKLKDPRWQKKRLEILNRDAFTCTTCGDKESALHVHHSSYKGDPWQAEDSELTTLCENCHELNHANDITVIKILILPGSFMKAYQIIMNGKEGVAIFKKRKSGYEYTGSYLLSDFIQMVSFFSHPQP